MCQYDAKCYRKNPTHFKEEAHPDRDDYEKFVQSLLKGVSNVSDENKTLIEKYKKTKGVSDKVHTMILANCEWKPKEFKKGRKKSSSSKSSKTNTKRKRSDSDDN